MISFFRRIRQNLLTENKFSKYLIYAFGEIILVVIGILIALSINNWNEKRKINEQSFSILKSISDELKSDQITVNKLLAQQIEKDKYSIQLSNFLHRKNLAYDTTALTKAFLTSHRVDLFSPINTAYKTLQTSGVINTIQSKELKEKLSGYYELSIREQDILVQFSEWTTDLGDLRMNYLPQFTLRDETEALETASNLEAPDTFYKTINLPWETIKRDSIFKINLEKVIALTMANQLMLKKSIKEQDSLLLLIDDYLEKE